MSSIRWKHRLRLDSFGSAEASPLIHDSYRRNRRTGSFVLIDPGTNETGDAGMIVWRRSPVAAAAAPQGIKLLIFQPRMDAKERE